MFVFAKKPSPLYNYLLVSAMVPKLETAYHLEMLKENYVGTKAVFDGS